MIRVEISRAKWGRGSRSDGSALKRADNDKMCCLGFVCLQAGVPEEKLVGMGYPHSLFMKYTEQALPWDHVDAGAGITVQGTMYGEPIPEMLKAFIEPLKGDTFNSFARSLLASDLVRVNDNPDISEWEREAELTKLAATGGIEFVFVD